MVLGAGKSSWRSASRYWHRRTELRCKDENPTQGPHPTVPAHGDVDSGQTQHHGLRRFRFTRFGSRLVEQGSAQGKVASPSSIGEHAVVAQPRESAREHMKKEAADELARVETHHLALVAVSVVAPSEANMLAIEVDESMIADGGLVSVAPEVGDYIGCPGKRSFGVDDPVIRLQRGLQRLERAGVVEAIVAGHAQLAAAVGGGEGLEILATEDLREGGLGEEESAPGRSQPALPVGAQGAVGDDAVDMDVLAEILPPSVEHHGDAEFAAEPPGIAAELEQGLRSGVEQQAVDESGIALGDGVELVRQGEYDVPVGDIEQIGALALDPSGLRQRLTLGAVAIPARCVLNGCRSRTDLKNSL